MAKKAFATAAEDRHYVAAEYLKKYPLLEKALDEQARFMHLMEPSVIKEDQPRMIEILDQTVDRPHAGKEALIAICIMMSRKTSPSQISGIRKRYSPETARILKSIQTDLITRTATPAPALMQIVAASTVCGIEREMANIQQSETALMKYRLTAQNPVASHAEQQQMNHLCANLKTPRLEKLLKHTHLCLQTAGDVVNFRWPREMQVIPAPQG
jgi:hypothetical protein